MSKGKRTQVHGSAQTGADRIPEHLLGAARAELRQMDFIERPPTGAAPPMYPDDWLFPPRQKSKQKALQTGLSAQAGGPVGLTPWESNPELLMAGTGELYRMMFDNLGSGPEYAAAAAGRVARLVGDPGPGLKADLAFMRSWAEALRAHLPSFAGEKDLEVKLSRLVGEQLELPPLHRWTGLTEWMRPLMPHEYRCLRGREYALGRIWERLRQNPGFPVVGVAGSAGVGLSSLTSAVAAGAIFYRGERWVPCRLAARNAANLKRELLWYLYRFGLYIPPGPQGGRGKPDLGRVLASAFEPAVSRTMSRLREQNRPARGPDAGKRGPQAVNLLFILDAGEALGLTGVKWTAPFWHLMQAVSGTWGLRAIVTFRETEPLHRFFVPEGLMSPEGPVRVSDLSPSELITVFLDRTGNRRTAMQWAHQAVVDALSPDAPQGRLRSLLAMAHCFLKTDSPEKKQPWRDPRTAMREFMADLMGSPRRQA